VAHSTFLRLQSLVKGSAFRFVENPQAADAQSVPFPAAPTSSIPCAVHSKRMLRLPSPRRPRPYERNGLVLSRSFSPPGRCNGGFDISHALTTSSIVRGKSARIADLVRSAPAATRFARASQAPLGRRIAGCRGRAAGASRGRVGCGVRVQVEAASIVLADVRHNFAEVFVAR
jgi:hypothetical protein